MNPSPGTIPHPSGVGSGRGLVRIGRSADRRNRGTGMIRTVGRSRTRGYGKSTSGSIRKIGRHPNRAN